MVFHYLASVPACAAVVLLHCSHVLFCACVSPSFICLVYLHEDCRLLWFLQVSFGLGALTAGP